MEIFFIILIFILISVISYLFGSIPSGVLIGKIFYHKDIREFGSHNSGGTNAGRTLGKKAGLITIILDMLKLIIPFFTCYFLFTYVPALQELMMASPDDTLNIFGKGNTLIQLTYYLSAFFVIIGHGHSIFLRFKGGKYVSTFAGAQISLSYLTFPLFGSIFFLILKIKKHVSESSIYTGGTICLFSWIVYIIYACTYSIGDYSQYLMWFNQGPTCSIYYPILMTVSYILLVYRHRENIKRLKEGTENSIKWMK